MIRRRETREVYAGTVIIGGRWPIVLQSMCASRTADTASTLSQIQMLQEAGAGLIRLAVDTSRDVESLSALRQETEANLVVDLQENFLLAESVAPFVQKIRYNPGHLHHYKKNVPLLDKLKFLVDVAGANNCALRIGVNSGSVDPQQKEAKSDPEEAALGSALENVKLLESLGFINFVVSLKSSDPNAVVRLNRRFSQLCPDVPLHLGVTEAGMLPEAEIKSRKAFEPLLVAGIGETVRVSLTVPGDEKFKEIEVARRIIADVEDGLFSTFSEEKVAGFDFISCPSCSRVENKEFVKLAEKVKETLDLRANTGRIGRLIKVAVMGCRVNGPGETDEADLGLWCGSNFVNLKKGTVLIGRFGYEDIIPRLLDEIDIILKEDYNKK